MEITEVKVRKIVDDTRLKAIVSVTIDDVLAIHDIKIIECEDRTFVAMPNRKDDSGMFRDIIHPMNAELRNEFEDVILNEYYRYIALMSVGE